MGFKIRCSAIGQIMTNARTKGQLSKTTQSYCESWLKEKIYGKRKEFTSKYTDKGILAEDANIEFANKMLGINSIKNEESFENDFLTGTPDIILENEIIDIKSSWDCFTFPLFDTEINTDYYYQLQGYMELTGKRKARLVYVLGDTPVSILHSEANKLKYSLGYDFEEALEIVKKKHDYSHVLDDLRIKVFDVVYDAEIIEKIKQRVKECEIYTNNLIRL